MYGNHRGYQEGRHLASVLFQGITHNIPQDGRLQFHGYGTKYSVYTIIAGCCHLLCSVMSLYLITAAPGGQPRRMNYISYPTMTLKPSHKHATAVKRMDIVIHY